MVTDSSFEMMKILVPYGDCTGAHVQNLVYCRTLLRESVHAQTKASLSIQHG